jgi:glycine/D-amino acid oxidase-like deaminating enzyme
VSSISIDPTTATMPFRVHTPRGTIRARHIVHATNGHSAALLPGLRSKLFPVRGQMTAQRPGAAFPHSDGARSWSIIRGKALEYMTQIPRGQPNANGSGAAGGDLLLGGGLVQSQQRGLDQIGVADDSAVDFAIGAYLSGALPMLFAQDSWNGSDNDQGNDQGSGAASSTSYGGSHVQDMWTGIMGFTADTLPLVGRLEESLTGRKRPARAGNAGAASSAPTGPAPGEWIAAGYSGGGMVNAWLCGVAVGLMVAGREDVAHCPVQGDGRLAGRVCDWLPREYLVSKKRLDRASVYELAALL